MVDIRKIPALADDPRDEEISKLREELGDLARLVTRVLASADQPAAVSQAEAEKKAEPLEPKENERARILAYWESEEKVLISIAPTSDDTRIRDDARARFRDPTLDYLPRTFQVNGVQLAVPVGRLTRVPLSIAQLYEYMLNPWQARGIQPPVTFDENEARIGIAA